MPLIDRPLLVSERPTLVDPVYGDDEEETEEDAGEVVEGPQVLGEGGGKVVHGIEFGEDDENIIKGANAVAMLATGDEGGTDIYKEIFTNAAIQLQAAENAGNDISGLVDSSIELDAHTIGVVWDGESEVVEPEPETDDEESETVEAEEDTSDEETSEE